MKKIQTFAAISILALTFVGTVQAQTHKCLGPNGKVVYSDKPCASGHTGGQIQLRENTIESRMDWERNERYIREQQSNRSGAQISRSSSSPSGSPDAARTPECEKAIRNANTQSRDATPQKIDGDRGAARRVCGFDPWPGPSATEIDAANKREFERRRPLVCNGIGGDMAVCN